MADESPKRAAREPKVVKAIEAPMASWVKGGTTSARYDEQIARQRADAEQRRAQEDQRRVVAREHPLEDVQKVMKTRISARQREMNLGGPGYAQVVLGVKHPRDSTISHWQLCEVVNEMGGDDMVLCMCCMRCIYTLGRSMSEAQTKIQNSHRAFTLDQRTKEQRKPNPMLGICAGELWVNPDDPQEVVTVAGMITTHGWQKCDALGCGWDFMIDDSVVYTR